LCKAVARVTETMRSPAEPATSVGQWTEEFWVPHRSEMIRIPASAIDRIEAERDYMRLHLGSRSFLLHQTISALEQKLDPAQFIRLHRSTIVRRDFIAKLHHDKLGTWYASLADGADVRIGRSFLAAAKALAGR
jgi:two-component system response regulator AlgR